jgi:hypothetical protein
MLAPDVSFEGFSYDDWQRVLELFRPVREGDRPRDPNRPRGMVVAVHHDGKLRKLLHSRVGRLRLDDLASDWPLGAEELARRLDASVAVSLESGALDDVMEELGARTRPDHSLTEQCLTLLSAAQYQMSIGRIDLWPQRLHGVPPPNEAMIDRSIDMVCPPGKTMLIGLFERDDLWTSIALRRSRDGFDMILGPEELRDELGLLSGDFRRDHRHLARAVTDRMGPLSLGCFADHRTFRALEVDARPGAWALAVAVRDVVLTPVPPAMALPLGLDAGRAAFSALRQVANRLDPGGVLSPAFTMLRDATIGDRSIEELLGFHPLELLRKLLSRDS